VVGPFFFAKIYSNSSSVAPKQSCLPDEKKGKGRPNLCKFAKFVVKNRAKRSPSKSAQICKICGKNPSEAKDLQICENPCNLLQKNQAKRSPSKSAQICEICGKKSQAKRRPSSFVAITGKITG
jgi:ribosomal protein S14